MMDATDAAPASTKFEVEEAKIAQAKAAHNAVSVADSKSMENTKNEDNSAEKVEKEKPRRSSERDSKRSDNGDRRRSSTNRSKRRSRSRSRGHQRSHRRSRSRSRDRRRSRRRSRSGSRDRRRSRRRSRSRSRGSRYNHPRHDRNRRDNHRPRNSRHRGRSPDRRPKWQRRRDHANDVDEMSRSSRCVSIAQLQKKVTERDVVRFFRDCGQISVRRCRLLREKWTDVSMGCGFVELKSEEDVGQALLMNGKPFVFKGGRQGFPCEVKAVEPDKVLTDGDGGEEDSLSEFQKIFAKPKTFIPSVDDNGDPIRLFVGNLSPKLTREDVLSVFKPFGQVTYINMKFNAVQECRPYCFVHYSTHASAGRALRELAGFNLGGQLLRITFATPQPAEDTYEWNTNSVSSSRVGYDKFKQGGIKPKKVNLPAGPDQWKCPKCGTNNSNKYRQCCGCLYQLSREDLVKTNGTIEGKPSSCLLVKNMFDPVEEEGNDWDVELQKEVAEECGKHGVVAHCFVDKNSQGNVYLRFDSLCAGINAAGELHGRWFSKRKIYVKYIPSDVYLKTFPAKPVASFSKVC